MGCFGNSDSNGEAIGEVDHLSNGTLRTPSAMTDNYEQIESTVAKALTELSMVDRDKVYSEIHGVDDETIETPKLVKESLESLNKLLDSLPKTHRKGQAIQDAISQSEGFVRDRDLQMKFLRSESFDVPCAADRMINFFDIKQYLFGKEKLCKVITLEDLDKHDLACLKAGFFQFLPARDRAGRAVCVIFPNFQVHETPENMTRVVYYVLMSATEDVETQKRGLSVLVYNVGPFIPGKVDLAAVRQSCWIERAIPMRTCSIHHCYSDKAFRFIINASMSFWSEQARARIKLHAGGHVECIYALMTYGLPWEAIPTSMDGELKRKSHLDWVKMRRQQEKDRERQCIIVPTHRDVLFGRGKPYREHRGNLRLFNLIDEKIQEYSGLGLKGKTEMIAQTVELIKEIDGRFLKQEGCVWVEVEDRLAREKVSHAFRTRMRIASSEHQDRSEDSNGSKSKVRPFGASLMKGNPADLKKGRFLG